MEVSSLPQLLSIMIKIVNKHLNQLNMLTYTWTS